MLRSEEPVEPTVERVTDGAVFNRWALDDFSMWDTGETPAAECTWNNGSVIYKSDFCSHFSLARLASTTASKAIERASKCSVAFESECILSPEIGLGIPAAFVPSEDGTNMAMLVAPRIIEATDSRHVKVDNPGGKARVLKLNYTVRVEYLPGGSRTPVLADLHGPDAWCVQLLRKSFVPDCWAELD